MSCNGDLLWSRLEDLAIVALAKGTAACCPSYSATLFTSHLPKFHITRYTNRKLIKKVEMKRWRLSPTFSEWFELIGNNYMLSVGTDSSESGKLMPSILEYFPELKGDLTKVVWAHAVNSISLLDKALSDQNVLMLEADVVLGKLSGKGEIIPIMAHPPLTVSDLSLEMFLKAAIKAHKDKRKGIKLDFKSIEAFRASTKIIDSVTAQLSFPVLLNADILPGPVHSGVKPVDADEFLNTCARKYPASTLSIGWTTKFGPGMEGVYTDEQLRNMLAAIERNKVMQAVTLCVRAGIAAGSPAIRNLVEQIDGYQKSKSTTVTIWMSSDSDPVDIPKLRNLILTLKKSKVLLDLPKFVEDKLDLDGGSTRTPIHAAQEALVALLTSVSAVFANMF